MIPILYEEPQFLLVNKPAGLLTQAVAGLPSLQSRLVEQLKQRDQHPGTPFVGLPHRLDRGTSGVLLIARNQRALKRLSLQFQHRRVQKFYLAWVAGRLSGPVERWHDFMRKVEHQPRAEMVAADAPQALSAEMEVCALTSDQETSLVLVRIVTGRMHQIRLQLASRGLPVVGDEMYGSTRHLGGQDLQSDSRLRPLALHALRLEFLHPTTALPKAVTAPVPDYWQQAGATALAAIDRLVAYGHRTAAQTWELAATVEATRSA